MLVVLLYVSSVVICITTINVLFAVKPCKQADLHRPVSGHSKFHRPSTSDGDDRYWIDSLLNSCK